MGLLENWRNTAYESEKDENAQKKFWADYFEVEKGIYEKLLAEPGVVVEGTVKELAERFGTSIELFTGFLDGINDSLVTPNKLDELEEESTVRLETDLEKLYYNMLAAKAHWLYELPAWDSILTPERRKEITKEQRLSGTVVKEEKPGRNDPCPCGSGKKYKKCCAS